MRKHVQGNVWTKAMAIAGVCAIALYAAVGAQGQAPRYKYDPEWPKPLPNKWKMGGVTGLAVDKDDNVWVYNRPADLTNLELEAGEPDYLSGAISMGVFAARPNLSPSNAGEFEAALKQRKRVDIGEEATP